MPNAGRARKAGRWKLEDAKARFSELVRRANEEGPQTVTVRGRETAVVIGASHYARLRPPRRRQPLVAFLEGLDLNGLDLARETDTGREIEL